MDNFNTHFNIQAKEQIKTALDAIKYNDLQIKHFIYSNDCIKRTLFENMKSIIIPDFYMFGHRDYDALDKYLRKYEVPSKKADRIEKYGVDPKDVYNDLLKIFSKLGLDITTIDSVVWLCGHTYAEISVEIYVTSSDSQQYVISIPQIHNLSYEDVFHGDYINENAVKIRVYKVDGCVNHLIFADYTLKEISNGNNEETK